MVIHTPLEKAEKVSANVNGLIMYSESRCQCIHLSLYPGEVVEKHTNPFDVVFIGLEGSADLLTDSGNISIKAGETVFVSKDTMRQFSNSQNEVVRIMVIKLMRET